MFELDVHVTVLSFKSSIINQVYTVMLQITDIRHVFIEFL